MIDWDENPNFSEHEFMCRCGCGRAEMDPDFMSWLQSIRTEVGQPFIISSGFRCLESDTSAARHRTGKAVDIVISNPWASIIMDLAIERGVDGKGMRQHGLRDKRFIHLDRTGRSAFWTYEAPPIEVNGRDT